MSDFLIWHYASKYKEQLPALKIHIYLINATNGTSTQLTAHSDTIETLCVPYARLLPLTAILMGDLQIRTYWKTQIFYKCYGKTHTLIGVKLASPQAVLPLLILLRKNFETLFHDWASHWLASDHVKPHIRKGGTSTVDILKWPVFKQQYTVYQCLSTNWYLLFI